MFKKTFSLTSILILAALLTGCAGTAFAQSPAGIAQAVTQVSDSETAAPRTLSVSGSGQAYLTPDIAYINIGVRTEGAEAATAVSENSTLSQKIADALKGLNVESKDIQTTNFSIFPQQKFDQDGKPTGEITYVVENTVYVTVRDLDNIGDLLDAAVTAGANQIYGIQFDVADKTAALSDARKAAVKNAQEIAGELASAAGVALGDIQTINMISASSPSPVYEPRGNVMFAEAASVPVSPGQMILTVEVTLVYQIQ
jgi:uncharacterized protein YggE